MAVSYSEYVQFQRDAIAGGYVYAFSHGTIGTLYFNTTVTGSGGTAGQSVETKPRGRYIAAPTIIDGLVRRADGSVFNPWGLAGKRAPTAYAAYTQNFIYVGHAGLLIQQYEKLMAFVGITGLLYLSYGRTTGDTYSTKYCDAMLQTVSGTTEGVLLVGSSRRTYIEFSATWQQTDVFTW